LIRTVLENPMIRYIVVCGDDLTGSGENLIALMKNGVDKNGKIIGASGYIDPSIPLNLIEKIRRSVKIIDLRGKENQLKEELKKLEKLPPFGKPISLPKKEVEIENLEVEEVGFKVSGKFISETWLKILDLVMKFGEIKDSEYGIKQKEILNVIAVIQGDEEKIPEWLGISEDDLNKYYESFFAPTKKAKVSYTYGERLFRYTLAHVPKKWKSEVFLAINQIEYVIKKLREVPHTRRAIAITWKPEVDIKSRSPPCLTQITWNVKNNRLYQTAVFRSQDIFGAWVMNAFALRKLQKYVGEKIGKSVGSLTIISNSAHVYEDKWELAEKLLEKHYRNKVMPVEMDPLGYFLIEIKDGEIFVQHYLNDGRKTKYCFRGKNAQELYRKILNENLISRIDHAAYLGYELARAEEALKSGKKFVQDLA
jgi:thymidylate synthase